MFRNLQAEIARKGMKNLSEFASVINMNSRTFSRKMAGITEFNLDEMIIIRDAIGNDCTLDYLFEINLKAD